MIGELAPFVPLVLIGILIWALVIESVRRLGNRK